MKSSFTGRERGFINLAILAVIAALIIGIIIVINKTNFLGDLRSRGQTATTATVTLSIASPSDLANEDNGSLTTDSSRWLGNATSATSSYLGMRFTGSSIPQSAHIDSAKIVFTPTTTQWITTSAEFRGESSVSTATFSSSSKPSSRATTSALTNFSDNVKWLGGQTYNYDVTPVLQELVNTSSHDNVVITAKGTGARYQRKFINQPSLVVTYTIVVANASPTPTSVSSSMPMPSGGGGASASFGIWDPSSPTYAAAGPQKYPTCTKAFHDSFFVIGPDGKKYPTWHPIVAVDPTTGIKCSFGHDHGRNPSQSALWPQIQNYFYYDANRNGVMDPSEQQVAGLPFGYANEQLDSYWAVKGIASMRHEDHVGHKVDFMNGEFDTHDHFFGTSTTGGVVVPVNNPALYPKWLDSGAKCTYLEKVHQGVSTKDAFTNNLHEVQYFLSCLGPTAASDLKINMVEMIPFGASGEFTNLCDAEGDRTTPVVLGKDSLNQNWPGTRGAGFRSIVQRDCIAKHFLVPQGTFSMNMYEAWSGSLNISQGSKTMVRGGNLLFDVEDANRYYYPGQPNNVGYSMNLCYEVLPGGEQAHTGRCDVATNYGAIRGITWNDTRSAFTGLHRGMYFQPPLVQNAGGPGYWYTDPFGDNASTTYFTGSIRQQVSSKNVDYSLNGNYTSPRVTDRFYDNGEGTVHAPN